MNKILLPLFFALIPVHILGQGIPLITEYTSEEYNSHRQNWAAVQGADGRMYVGNSAGIVIFDGSDWEYNHVGGGNVVRSFERASDSTIYYGGQNEFGFIGRDSLNSTAIVSLRESYLPDSLEFGAVSSIVEYEGSIYFQASSYIFKYSGSEVQTLEAETSFTRIFLLDKKLHVFQREKGVMELKDASLRLIPGGDRFKDEIVYGTVSFGSEDLLFSRPSGITVFRNGDFIKPGHDWISEMVDNRIYRVTKVDESTFAVGTLAGGVYIADRNLNLLHVIDEQKGLRTNLVYNLFTDTEKNIWALLDDGINLIHYGQPVTTYDERKSLFGAVTDIEQIGTRLYAGTTEGLYMMDRATQDTFSRVDGVLRVVDMEKVNNEIWVNDIDKVSRITKDVAEPLVDGAYNSVSFINQKDSVYFTRGSEVFKAGPTFDEGAEQFIDAGSRIVSLIYHENFLWVLTTYDVRKYDSQGNEAVVYSLNRDDGVARFLNVIQGRVVAGTDWGLFVYDLEKNLFTRPERHGGDPFGQAYFMKECAEQEVWLRADMSTMRGGIVNDNWGFNETPYQLIGADVDDTIYDILCDGQETWFGGANGIYHLPDLSGDVATDFNTNITKLFVNRDSLIYGGYGSPGKPTVLPYADNQLRFTFAGASFIRPADSEYRVRLDGFDDGWSTWSDEGFKDYTNIPEGDYTLRVQSKNLYDVAGTEAIFSFSVLPPWYRAMWAYLLYFLLFGGAMYAVHYVRVRQILKIQNIRNRIAGDLHDEVSATLSSISYFAKAVERGSEEKRGRFVSLISESADDAKEKITDIIWAINPEHDDWERLMAKCRRYASDLLESKDIKHQIDISDQITGKPKVEVRQHFWLMFKEIMTNAVRHSGAEQINITIRKDGNKLVLIVQDNGEGFNMNIIEKGNGLSTIKQRAEKIGGSAELNTEEGFGTRWSLKVNL
ncbi:sensor histidine kinase [Rhodohalobacter sp. 8-1]|uniref:sensor histidine kinase n=1 Tax=Rhodohalobacter sp. 8-1 TaxID=3131972 RepID=UPI0030EDCEBB